MNEDLSLENASQDTNHRKSTNKNSKLSHNYIKEYFFTQLVNFTIESTPTYSHGIFLSKESQKTERVNYTNQC